MKTIFTLTIFCFLFFLSNAQPGSLDRNFGSDGKVIGSFEGYNTAQSVLIEKDQKIIVVGNCSTGGIAVRYNTNGIIDSSFGVNGVFITTEFQSTYKITAVLQKDDKIIVTGVLNDELKLIRLLNNGQPDISFGVDGIATIKTNLSIECGGVAIQSDGKIVVAADDFYNIYTARWLSNGKPDSSYGTNALAILAIPESYNYARAIAISPEDKIIIAGTNWSEYPAFITARFLNNGMLDTNFNKTGYIIDVFDRQEFIYYNVGAYSCAIQPDGKIIVAGTSTLNTLHGIGFVLVRYNIDGSRDKTFAYSGVLELNVNNGASACNAITLQKDGKIVAAGAQNTNFLLTRFTSSGFTDTTFGISNYTTSTDFGSDEAPHAIALQANGKIVVAGNSSDYGSINNIALTRYNNDTKGQKQIIISKIRSWLQHRNGIVWDNIVGATSYAVQRSGDGINWAVISKPAVNNSSLSYYNDATPLSGNNYYRLKTTSTDGAVAYSNVIAVNNSDIKISPNPAKNILQIQGLLSNQKNILSIVDFNGNIKLKAVANASSYNLNITSLKAGNYLLKIEANNEVVTKKFVKE